MRIILRFYATNWIVNRRCNRLKPCKFNSDRITTIMLATGKSMSNIEWLRKSIPIARQVWKTERICVQLAVVIQFVGAKTAIQEIDRLELRRP